MKVSRKITIWLFLILIRAYQRLASPWFGDNCRFVPSCSAYVMKVLKTHGLFHGIFLGLKRILRCHPWGKNGYDPPAKEKNI